VYRRARRAGSILLAAFSAFVASATPAQAVDQLCDPAYENCRTILINLIRNEQVGIDVAFWFMEDSRYTAELISRFRAGVPVRVLVDPRANTSNAHNAARLGELEAAGIPMRKRVASGILHWKMMLFAGQDTVQFSAANYSADAFVHETPYSNYVDEAIYFTDHASVVNSFRTKFDDLWTNTSTYADYANVSGPLRRQYGTFSKDPELNFAPAESYRSRAVGRYNAEAQGIDVVMYRITDRAHTDAIIAAKQRGVAVRLITEPLQYRDVGRLWHSWNVDRLYTAGIEIRHRAHAGLTHQKSVILRGQRMVAFGSSNWTSPSAQSQEEHNYFTQRPELYAWFVDQFERKWNNTAPAAETTPFTPLPPDKPASPTPSHGAAGAGTSVTLTWRGGPWAHVYDVYFGTAPDPPLFAGNLALGPSEPDDPATEYQHLAVSNLAPGTTYYWRVVSKTMADVTHASDVWSFTTSGASQPVSRPLAAIDTPADGAIVGTSFSVAGWALDTGAAQGTGVDAVHVYAYPAAGGNPIFLGAAAYGLSRPDVGAIYGARFTNSAFALNVVGTLAPADYHLVVFHRSTVTRAFTSAIRVIRVRGTGDPFMSLDTPSNGASLSQPFPLAGWAIDRHASSGPGVDVLHVWAFPTNGGPAIFLGIPAYGYPRPDVGGIFGSQFTNSGYNLAVTSLPPGSYHVVVYARSTVTGSFSQWRVVSVDSR
jgi:phosphatidylserine/phosphatidylglycerophosphate/cardiolipin synthase-like enzyme